MKNNFSILDLRDERAPHDFNGHLPCVPACFFLGMLCPNNSRRASFSDPINLSTVALSILAE
jgi:hypothetical protein